MPIRQRLIDDRHCLCGHHVYPRHGLRGLAHIAYPNIFPSPISPSSFPRRGGVSVRNQAIDDDDNPVAAISIHWEFSPALRNSTDRYNPGICTSALHKDATSSLEKTEHPHQCLGPCTHMSLVSQLGQAEQQI